MTREEVKARVYAKMTEEQKDYVETILVNSERTYKKGTAYNDQNLIQTALRREAKVIGFMQALKMVGVITEKDLMDFYYSNEL